MTAERVEEGDVESWHAEWRRTAERVAAAAEAAADEGRSRTARFAFLRAHTYVRTAEFFPSAADSRRLPTYERSREAFRAAMDRLDSPPERVEVPYDGTTLPRYLFRPPTIDGPASPRRTPRPPAPRSVGRRSSYTHVD